MSVTVYVMQQFYLDDIQSEKQLKMRDKNVFIFCLN